MRSVLSLFYIFYTFFYFLTARRLYPRKNRFYNNTGRTCEIIFSQAGREKKMKKSMTFMMILCIVLAGCQSSQVTEMPPAVKPAPVTPPPAEEPAVNPPPAEPAVKPAPPREDREGPVLNFNSSIDYFSPDDDGVNDVYIATLGVEDESPIQGWTLDIREPVAPYVLFAHFEGEGDPPSQIAWDGKNKKGELVQSASDYLITFIVADVKGNSSTMEGLLQTDILVIREGDRLRVQVPSIVFAADKGTFEGLPADVLDNNEWILRRVAQVLNKFGAYRVTVEGHGNAVLRTAREETTELKPLSEARAKTVVEELVGYGVARRRLTAVGMGGSRPVAPYEDRNGWWKNRRVEFILIK
jgi:outer membrane protein OmpA-like peptidoglycan-associated protein